MMSIAQNIDEYVGVHNIVTILRSEKIPISLRTENHHYVSVKFKIDATTNLWIEAMLATQQPILT